MFISDYFVIVIYLFLWNGYFLKCSGYLVDLLMFFFLVYNVLKFFVVFGSLFLNNLKIILFIINRNVFNNV